MDLIGHGVEQVLQELLGRLSVSRCNELSDGELRRSVDADEEVKPIVGKTVPRTVFGPSSYLGGLNLSYVDMEEPDGIPLELLPLGLVAFNIGQARDAVTLQAQM